MVNPRHTHAWFQGVETESAECHVAPTAGTGCSITGKDLVTVMSHPVAVRLDEDSFQVASTDATGLGITGEDPVTF